MEIAEFPAVVCNDVYGGDVLLHGSASGAASPPLALVPGEGSAGAEISAADDRVVDVAVCAEVRATVAGHADDLYCGSRIMLRWGGLSIQRSIIPCAVPSDSRRISPTAQQ